MNWDFILQNDPGPDTPLKQRLDALFAQQRATWPALRDGEAALQHLQTKTLTHEGDEIIVQVNPARRRSTHAKTDSHSVAARACFLCPENMPLEERGVAFEDLVVLPNPYPVLPRHCTIAGRQHRPQQLAGRVGTLLRLAAAAGPEMAAFYNGPRCGASAPDHFHFQAASAAEIPILQQLPQAGAGRRRAAHTSFGRSVLLFISSQLADVESDLEQAIEALRRKSGSSNEEPMLNLIAHYRAEQWVVLLFPRRAHRPACYFATGPEHLAVSPAVLEMAGILVTTAPDDFARLNAITARSIYEEVSLDRGQFIELAAGIGSESRRSNSS